MQICFIHADHKCESTETTVESSVNTVPCGECQQIREHKQLVKNRKLYTEDKEKPWLSDHSFRSVDLQKIPRLPGVKTAVFT